jgi:iron complex outermembrane receptor protein
MNKAMLLAACAGTALASAETVLAQQRAANDATTVAQIVVTAQKREESLQSVPVAISAYTSKRRDLIGVDSIQDLTNYTPGLAYSTSLDRAFIRGVGRQTNNLATEPGVATYADGVYNSSVIAAAGDSLFVSRVEILRGPQGTLYGRNSVGGTINSISNFPTSSFYAEGRATVGNYGVYNFEAAVSGPITDTLRVRLAAAQADQADGYFKNVAGGPSEGGRGNSTYVEAQVSWDLTPKLNLWLKGGYYRFSTSYRTAGINGSYDYAPFPPGSLAPGAAFGYTQPGFVELGSVTTNPGASNIRTFSTDIPEKITDEPALSAAAHLTWNTPWGFDVKYIGGFTTYNLKLTTDYDNTSMLSYNFPTVPSFICFPLPACPPLKVFPQVPFNYAENKSYYSNELDFVSNNTSRVQWIFGLYQFHEEYNQYVQIPLPAQPQLAFPAMAAPNPTFDIYHTEQNMHEDSYAGFAQVDWKFTDTLKFTGGIRYNHDTLAGAEEFRELCFGLPACGFPAALFGAFTPVIDITPFVISYAPAPGVAGPPSVNAATGIWSRPLSQSWSAVTGTAGFEWTPNVNTLAYLKYSRGYKAGGFNTGTILANPETNPEYIDAYEIGAKEQIARSLQINAAVFYYDYYGMQIPLSFQEAQGPIVTNFFNMGKVVSYGAELETIWQATRDLQFLFNYAYLHATVHSGCCFEDTVQPQLGGQSVVGETVPQSPRNKVAVNANYTLHFDPGNLTFSASYIWKDQTYDSIFNRPWYLAPSYSQVDARITYTDAKDRFTIIGYVKNLTNALGTDNISALLLAAPTPGALPYNQTIGLIPPRTYGVELQVRFR